MPVPFVQANTNGRLHAAHEPSLPPLDRGFLYGDAVYEVWRTYAGAVFTFAEHWARLETSAASLYLTLPLDPATALAEIARTTAAYRSQTSDTGELYIRLQVSRGGGAIGLDPALADAANWVILVQPLPRIDDTVLQTGLRVAIARGIRRNHPLTLDPLWKSGNYLNNILALREARAAGASEVLLLNLAGEITEASTMSVAFVRDGQVFTPPLSAGILASITRRFLIDRVAPRAGVTVHETTLRTEDLPSMQEAFFLSTTKDLTPIAQIDTQRFTTGPATLTSRLKAIFADVAQAHCAAHAPPHRV